jgi:hypothetical protein
MVDEKRTDLRAALRDLASEESGDIGRHVGLKRLIAYRQETLPEAEREKVQEHLSLCPRCTGLLRELRDFEAAAAGGDAGPESLRQEAWSSLVRRLPAKTPVVRPLASAPPPAARRHFPNFVIAAAAALLLAVVGLALWAAITVRQERQLRTRLERRLEERDAALAALQKSLAEAERHLAARGQDPEKERLERRIAELSATIAELRGRPTEKKDQIAAASPGIEVSVAPRFVLRGQPLPGDLLRGGGAVNPVRSPRGERFAVAFDLTARPAFTEYRLELLDRNGKLLWAGRRPDGSLSGDAGTSVSIGGLSPGRYRLRIEGVRPDGSELLAEYLLQVAPQ